MSWVAGVGSIVVMLLVLAVPASHIETFSLSTSSQQWYGASWLVLAVAVGMWLWLLFRSFNRLPKGVTAISQIALTLTLLTCTGLAVLTHSVAGRVALHEQSLSQTVYVTATVTPIGLSDKIWQPAQSANANPSPYRQLVTLTDIEPFVDLQQDPSQTAQVTQQTNPFGISSVADSDQAHQPNMPQPLSQSMPQNMTVLLTAYRAEEAWLNELSPTTQTRVHLALHPVAESPDTPTTTSAFDEYRWLSTRHATAKAYVLKTNAHNSHPPVGTDPMISGISGMPSLGTVHNIPPQELSLTQRINEVRFGLRQHFIEALGASTPEGQAQAVTLSLLTGDRSLLDKDTTALYRFAGISHLLAISGTHVLFLAILLAKLTTGLVSVWRPHWYLKVSRWQVTLWVAVSVAFLYALFAGFDVPAVRTAWMLLAVGMVRYFLVDVPVLKVLLGLAVLMAWQDVFVLWQAGFWLSFVAVAFLLIYGMHQPLHDLADNRKGLVRWGVNEWRAHQPAYAVQNTVSPLEATCHSQSQPTQHTLTQQGLNHASMQNHVAIVAIDRLSQPPSLAVTLVQRMGNLFWQFAKLQWWITLALLPISLWLFGKVSLWGILINLVAIGLFGWVVVPLNLLAGVLFPIAPPVANWLWELVANVLGVFHTGLLALQQSAQYTGWLHHNMGMSLLLLFGLASLPFLLPRGVINRAWTLPIGITAVLISVFGTPRSASESEALPSRATPTITTIVPLPLANRQWSAALVTVQHPNPDGLWQKITSYFVEDKDHWLLLSYYPKFEYGQKHAKPANTAIDDKPFTDPAVQEIHDALRQHKVAKLTGVVGQTTTLELVGVVNELQHALPILQYWQAGWSNTTPMPAVSSEDGTALSITPQPCVAGKTWHNQARQVSLTAVTGWQALDDNRVHDCTLLLNEHFNEHHSSSVSTQNPSAQNMPKQDIPNQNVSHKDVSHIFYSSPQPMLANLWAVMCDAPDTTTHSSLPIRNANWWLAPQARPSISLLQTWQPNAVHIMPHATATPTKEVIQVQHEVHQGVSSKLE